MRGNIARNWVTAIGIVSMLLLTLPIAGGTDYAGAPPLRVSNEETFLDEMPSPFEDTIAGLIYPVIDGNGSVHFTILVVNSTENGVDVALQYVKKIPQGAYDNSTIEIWHFTSEEWGSQMNHWIRFWSRLYLGPDDVPYVFYQLGTESPDFKKMAIKNDGVWISSDLPTGVTIEFGKGDTVVIDHRGVVHLTFLDHFSTNQGSPSAGLKYANNVGGDWNLYLIENVFWGTGHFFYNIDADASGTIHIYYRNNEWDAIDASLVNGAWRKSILFDVPANYLEFPRYTVLYVSNDEKGHHHIYYHISRDRQTDPVFSSDEIDNFYMTDSSGTWTNVSVPNGVLPYVSRINDDYIIKTDVQVDYKNEDGSEERSYIIQVHHYDGSEWTSMDVFRYHNIYEAEVLINDDGTFDVFTYDYYKRYTITELWPENNIDCPSNLVADPGNECVNLTWEASEGAELYRIYRMDPFTDTFTILNNTNSTKYVDNEHRTIKTNMFGLQTVHLYNGLEYRYVVTALTVEGESAPSNFVNVTPRTTPEAPEDLFAFYDGNSVALIWSPPADDGGADISGYDITCKNFNQEVLWNVSLGNVTIFDTGDFAPGNGYMFRVTAKNAAGAGGSSSFEYVVPSADQIPFYVLSQKSSTSNEKFDNDSQTVTFTVSGSDGSLGSSFVVIPKDLVGNGSDLRATIDGSDLPIIVQETDSAYVISMSYHHSTHEVVVYWGDEESYVMVALAIALIGIVALAGAVWYLKRKN